MAETIPLVDVENIANSLSDNRSEVADYIQDTNLGGSTKMQPQSVESQAQSSGFDAKKHAVDKNGQPVLTITGKFRKKRQAVVNGVKTSPNQSIPPINGGIGSLEGQRKMAANVATDATFSLGMILGGDAAKPLIDAKIGIDERFQMFVAWDNYLRAKNINDIPPGVALAIGLSGYAIRVAMLDATRQKTKGFWAKIKDKIVNVTASKIYATQPLSGNDGKRENNTSTKDSGSTEEAGRAYFSVNTAS